MKFGFEFSAKAIAWLVAIVVIGVLSAYGLTWVSGSMNSALLVIWTLLGLALSVIIFFSFHAWISRDDIHSIRVVVSEADEGKIKSARRHQVFIADSFLAHTGLASPLLGSTLVALSGLLLGFREFPWPHTDVDAFVCGSLGLAILLHRLVTGYRISSGYFGGNRDEAEELIRFIVKKNQGSGFPPGSRLSRPYREEARTVASPVTEVAGAI